MNAMGACAQLMGLDGTLRWAFVPDPQRQTRVFVKDEAAAAQGRWPADMPSAPSARNTCR